MVSRDLAEEHAPPMYQVGKTYSRADIYELLRIPAARRGGDWVTGYHRHGSDYYIFCHIGTAARTGDKYGNKWEGSRLIWFGKHRSNFEQETIVPGSPSPDSVYRPPHLDSADPVRIDWDFRPLTVVTP